MYFFFLHSVLPSTTTKKPRLPILNKRKQPLHGMISVEFLYIYNRLEVPLKKTTQYSRVAISKMAARFLCCAVFVPFRGQRETRNPAMAGLAKNCWTIYLNCGIK